MLRLVWKDVSAARWLLIAGLPIYLVQLTTVGWVEPLYLTVTLLFTVFMAFGSIVMEEIQGTEGLWCSLPVTRRQVVLARYFTALAGSAAGLAISGGVSSLLRMAGPLPGGRPAANPGLTTYASLFLWLALLAALFLPFRFRFGVGKGILMFAAFGIAATITISLLAHLALYLAGMSNPLIDPASWTEPAGTAEARALEWIARWGPFLFTTLAAITALVLSISAGLSRQFYEKRDL